MSTEVFLIDTVIRQLCVHVSSTVIIEATRDAWVFDAPYHILSGNLQTEILKSKAIQRNKVRKSDCDLSTNLVHFGLDWNELHHSAAPQSPTGLRSSLGTVQLLVRK